LENSFKAQELLFGEIIKEYTYYYKIYYKGLHLKLSKKYLDNSNLSTENKIPFKVIYFSDKKTISVSCYEGTDFGIINKIKGDNLFIGRINKILDHGIYITLNEKYNDAYMPRIELSNSLPKDFNLQELNEGSLIKASVQEFNHKTLIVSRIKYKNIESRVNTFNNISVGKKLELRIFDRKMAFSGLVVNNEYIKGLIPIQEILPHEIGDKINRKEFIKHCKTIFKKNENIRCVVKRVDMDNKKVEFVLDFSCSSNIERTKKIISYFEPQIELTSQLKKFYKKSIELSTAPLNTEKSLPISTPNKKEVFTKGEINSEALCILRYEQESNEVIVDYEPIVPLFNNEINNFKLLCKNKEDSFDRIISFLKGTISLKKVNKYYHYCDSLNGSFQGVSFNIQQTIEKINQKIEELEDNQQVKLEEQTIKEEIEEYKHSLYEDFQHWIKAYSIDMAYDKCRANDKILTYSHRECGWSNPVYKLNQNFSIELKTNFGYGRSSYFFVKVKYKNIELVPFSEWVNYQMVKSYDIIRYTKSFQCHNHYWKDALEYSKDACNLANKDEVAFISKYILSECEEMVEGLEHLLKNNKFTFKNIINKTYEVNKNGYELIEYRGEKISGALDFVSRIIEYKKIIKIISFIERIEKCNRIIQPILTKESNVISIELKKKQSEMQVLEPVFNEIQQKNERYIKLRNELKLELIKDRRERF
jgi:hypothetical protein